MRVSTVYPRKYLRVDDLAKGQRVPVTIVDVTEVSFGKESKLVLWFLARPQGLVLNATNAHALASCYGEETSAWIGRELLLFVAPVDYHGDLVFSICIQIVRNPARAALHVHQHLPAEATSPLPNS